MGIGGYPVRLPHYNLLHGHASDPPFLRRKEEKLRLLEH